MGYNVAVFAWRKDLATHAGRKKAGVTFPAVHAAICESGTHAALGPAKLAAFDKALAKQLGTGADAPYTLEKHPRARIVRLAYRDVPRLVIEVGKIARTCGLTSSGDP